MLENTSFNNLMTGLDHPILHNDNSDVSFKDFENRSNTPFLVSILDLTRDDIGYLEEAKSHMESKLKEVYGFNEDDDQLKLYFHFPYDESTLTLHIHARMNQGSHPLEEVKSFQLDDVIDTLKSEGSVKSLIYAKQQNHNGCIFRDTKPKKGISHPTHQIDDYHFAAESVIKDIPGIELNILDNSNEVLK
jgi:hypothetical protein